MTGDPAPSGFLSVAAYLQQQYFTMYGIQPDEMKMHKLLYLCQRESYVQYDAPLFDATFYGWKYGPVLKEIRNAYASGVFALYTMPPISSETQYVVDLVLKEYSGKSSWSLSRLTHGEQSWIYSRINIPSEANSDNPMSNEDIRMDAQRIRERRQALARFNASLQ